MPKKKRPKRGKHRPGSSSQPAVPRARLPGPKGSARAARVPPSVAASHADEPRTSPLAPQPETLRGWLGEAERRLAGAGIDSPRLDAQLLVAAALGEDVGALRFAEDRTVSSRDGQRIENFLRRRAKTREPVSRILGRREFWSLEFRVTPAVLDPRPDSETLIEAALAAFPEKLMPFTVLDLGTGSGCLLLAVLHERPNAVGLGVDASEQALAVARANAKRLGLAERVEFRHSDWAAAVTEAFDLVLCNPPYIAENERAALAPEVARHDPRAALFAGPDGLDAYRVILPDLPRLLAPGGLALFEIGASQAEAVTGIAGASGVAVLEVGQDLAGRDRCVAMQAGEPTA